MRAKISRTFKRRGALNGIDLSAIFGAVSSVANTVTSVVNSNKPTGTTVTLPTNTSAGSTFNINDYLKQFLPASAVNTTTNNAPAPAATDNTLLYVGLGGAALLGLTAVFMMNNNNGKRR